MSPEDLTLSLWRDYNKYYTKTFSYKSKKKHKILVLSDESLDLLKKMISFCCKHQLDPRRWLWVLFAIRKWRFPPTFKCLVSKKALKMYATIDSSAYQNEIIKGKLNYDPRVDITNTVESIKKRYQVIRESERCMAHIGDETLGYHPKSLICSVCWCQGPCQTALLNLIGATAVAARKRD